MIFDRYHDKVKHWILVNQINLISHESFNHLGVAEDMVDDLKSAKFRLCIMKWSLVHALHDMHTQRIRIYKLV